MLSDHAWILDEKRYFGHANTAYDFKTNDPKEAGRRIQKLQDTKDKLSKSVNMRAMNMLGKAEEQVITNLLPYMSDLWSLSNVFLVSIVYNIILHY